MGGTGVAGWQDVSSLNLVRTVDTGDSVAITVTKTWFSALFSLLSLYEHSWSSPIVQYCQIEASVTARGVLCVVPE